MKTTKKYVNRHNGATYIQLYIHLISLSKHYVTPIGGPATLWANAGQVGLGSSRPESSQPESSRPGQISHI